MKRLIALMLVVIVLALTACQRDLIYCPECGGGFPKGASFCSNCGESLPAPTEAEEYCSKCGQLVEEEGMPAEESVPKADAEKIEQARSMMIERWQEIAVEDKISSGYFEIKNTRIIWLEDVSVEVFSTVYYPECVVEFDIYTDYEGAAPYYFEMEYQNDVIFYTDGTAEVNEEIAEWFWDPEEFAGKFSVVDYGDAFNLTIDLFDYIPEVTVTDDAPAWDYPVDEAPQELLPKDDTNYSILDMGACNGNVYWEIRSNGVLYIYGMGAIPNYEYDGAVPWLASPVCSEITDVVISDGISGVGGRAFDGLRLASIYFGHDVIVYEWTGGSLIVNTAYIPASMEADGFVTASYHRELGMTIYYEGDAEEFKGKYLVNSDNPLGPKNYDKYIVYGDFEY